MGAISSSVCLKETMLRGVNFQPANVRLIQPYFQLLSSRSCTLLSSLSPSLYFAWFCWYYVADLSPALQLRNTRFAADTVLFQQFCSHRVNVFSHELRWQGRWWEDILRDHEPGHGKLPVYFSDPWSEREKDVTTETLQKEEGDDGGRRQCQLPISVVQKVYCLQEP